MNRAIQDVENDSYDLRAPESTWVCCDLFPALVLRIYEIKGLTLSDGVLVHQATTQFEFESPTCPYIVNRLCLVDD